MLSSKKNNVNDLLDNDGFIAWVTSNYKTNHAYWSGVEAGLSKADKVEFAKAIDVLKKLKTLHIDDDKSMKSQDFIKAQYASLMKDYASNEVKQTKVFKLNTLFKYAAVLVVLISIAAVMFLSNNSSNTFADHLVETAFNTSDLLLQTPENKYYVIPNKENETWLNDDGVLVQITPESIRFTAQNHSEVSENQIYKIIVPEGKKYLLSLVDSTNVELNSNTNIAFTNSTTSKQRNIKLKGEAFFDVTHDKNRPFIVQSSDLKIQVLGTEFNVSNYETNGFTSTTLIDGSINVSTQQGESKIITPGYQAILRHNQSTIVVEKVNVQKAVSWTTNRMIFEDETLAHITEKLSAWYPVTFNLNGENIKQTSFTGTLKKENSLIHFLQMLKYTEGISYKINNDQVTLFFE